MLRTLLGLAAVLIGFTTAADVPETKAYRDRINQDLINLYESGSRVVEVSRQIPRGDTVQPIHIVHRNDLTDSDRVLVVALDDGARNLFLDIDHVVIAGIPFADRIRDLIPPVSDEPGEGTPEHQQLRVTTPDSDAFLQYLQSDVLPYLDREYGPFKHKILFGYSFGGIFTIQAIMQAPELFDAFIAGSPSLWYRYDYYESLALEMAKTPDRLTGKCLIYSSGEDEPTIHTATRQYDRLLRGLDLPVHLAYQRNNETDHSYNRTVSFIYGWDQIYNADDIFPSAAGIAPESLDTFNSYLSQWLERNSCTPFGVTWTTDAYSRFAEKLAKAEDWQELRTLHDFVSRQVAEDSTAYGFLLLGILSHFKDMPEEEKSFWAEHYTSFMARAPVPGLAVHFINRDIIDFLESR